MNANKTDSRWHRRPIGADARTRRWLIDRGSLTQRIQRRSKQFRVELVSLTLAAANRDEGGSHDSGGRGAARRGDGDVDRPGAGRAVRRDEAAKAHAEEARVVRHPERAHAEVFLLRVNLDDGAFLQREAVFLRERVVRALQQGQRRRVGGARGLDHRLIDQAAGDIASDARRTGAGRT